MNYIAERKHIINQIMRIFLIGVVVLMSTSFVFANEDNSLEVFNSRLVTSNQDATYVEGEVSNAVGQEILIKYRLRTIAKKQMPNNGRKTRFRIKIPAKYIDKDKTAIMNVVEKGSGRKNKERLEIEYIERKHQDIKVKKNYELTFPGLDANIGAKTSSGESLSYVSSKPEVVSVDDTGKITPIGAGEATVTIRQIGSSAFEAAEETVKVSVKAIDAYTITFHSTKDDGTTEETKQIVEMGQPVELHQSDFNNGDHEFLGWATSEEDYVSFLEHDTVTDIANKGDDIDLYAVWSGHGIKSAISWAIKIAADDSFSYGKKPETSKVGCYFCGTTRKYKPKGYEKTYVCMPFITAAYAHGAEDPEMIQLCQTTCLSLSETNFKFSCWEKVGNASNLSVSDMQPGDVICYYSAMDNSGHLAMYMGDDKIVDATSAGGDPWGPKTIAVRDNSAASYLRGAARHHSKSYVMRYVGPSE